MSKTLTITVELPDIADDGSVDVIRKELLNQVKYVVEHELRKNMQLSIGVQIEG
jgi:hypothetical protein